MDVDVVTELQAILARLSPTRRVSLLDYAHYLAACEEQESAVAFPDWPSPAELPPDDDVLDDCRRRGYGGLLGREP